MYMVGCNRLPSQLSCLGSSVGSRALAYKPGGCGFEFVLFPSIICSGCSALPRSLLLSSRVARQAKREEFRETNLRELKRKLSPDKQTSPKVQHTLIFGVHCHHGTLYYMYHLLSVRSLCEALTHHVKLFNFLLSAGSPSSQEANRKLLPLRRWCCWQRRSVRAETSVPA